MKIGGSQTRTVTGARADNPATRPEIRPETGRALVPVAPPAPTRPEPPSPRPAAFLAHLVAMRDHAPQTRTRRRVEPAEAALVYRTAAMRMTAAPGPARLSRTV